MADSHSIKSPRRSRASTSSPSLSSQSKGEKTSLLPSSSLGRRKKRRHCYTCKWLIKSKGTLLVLVWLALVQSFDPVVVISHTGLGDAGLEKVFLIYTCFSLLFYLFFPVIGLYADIKFGQLRVAQSAITVCLISTILVGIGAGLAEDHVNMTNLVVFSFGFILGTLSQTAFVIVMASYGFEQLLGASSEELAAYSHWYYWCRIFGWFLTVPVICAVNFNYGALIVYSLHIICLLVVLVSSFFSKRLGVIEMHSNPNPVKQMIKVFSYAKRYKYPKNRSALTYWEQTSPSRLDLGKEKYGGPFTEDEVEDVKTFLKMLPLIVCMVFFVIIMDQFNPYFFMANTEYNMTFEDCLFSSVYFANNGVTLIVMILYQIFKPSFDSLVPTMLRRIGIGIFLVLVTEVIWLGIDLAGHFRSDDSYKNSTCLFDVPQGFNPGAVHWNISRFWILLPKVVMGIAFGIAIPTTLEFMFAQAPHSMKGLVIGVWFMASGSLKMIGFSMHYPFRYLNHVQPNCSFYYYLSKTVLVAISLLCFIALAMWYRPRQRGLVYNSHATVEEFYEKDFERREIHEYEERRRRMNGLIERDVATLDINEYLSTLY